MTDPPDIFAVRATFLSALLPDERHAPPMSQHRAEALITLLHKTLNVCTSSNIQQCKNSIIFYILPSLNRTAALLNYLLALSRSVRTTRIDLKVARFSPGGDDEVAGLQPQGEHYDLTPSGSRRLHVIYILHDVFQTARAWQNTQLPTDLRHLDCPVILAKFKAHMMSFVRLAACRGESVDDEISQQLLDVVAQWKHSPFFEEDEIKALESLIRSGHERTWEQALEDAWREDDKRAAEERKAREEAQKWVLPLRHGVKDDPDAPWHELPAANGLYMKRTRGFPLRAGAFPKGGYELTYEGQEADSDLQKDVSRLHTEMLHCFDSYADPEQVQDIDALGNKVWKDPERPTRNYWGFTYDGIEKAKENSQKFKESARGYDDVAPLISDAGLMDDPVARARALAGGRGGFDNRGGRGRGGRGAPGGGWRGPPRGRDSSRGGSRGNGPPGRYY